MLNMVVSKYLFASIQIMQSYNWIMKHCYTGLWKHSYSNVFSMERMHMHYNPNTTANNVKCIHPVAYICFNTLKYILPLKVPDWVLIPGPLAHKASMLNSSRTETDKDFCHYRLYRLYCLTFIILTMTGPAQEYIYTSNLTSMQIALYLYSNLWTNCAICIFYHMFGWWFSLNGIASVWCV